MKNINNKNGGTAWDYSHYAIDDILASYGFVYMIETDDKMRYIGKCRTMRKNGKIYYTSYRGSGRDLIKHYALNNYDYSKYKYTILQTASNAMELKELEQHYISLHNAKNSDMYLNIANAQGSDCRILNIPKIALDAIVGSYSESIRYIIKKYFIDKPKLVKVEKSDCGNTQISVSNDLFDLVNMEAKRLNMSVLAFIRAIFDRIG